MYLLGAIAILTTVCAIAEICYRIEIKRYKKSLENRSDNAWEKQNTTRH